MPFEQSEPDFHSGCLAVKAALDFVELEHMGPLLEIFSRAHRRHHPNVDVTEDEFISRANIAYEGSMSSTEKISMSLQEALQPFGLQVHPGRRAGLAAGSLCARIRVSCVLVCTPSKE